jgi:hypothetical protein
MRVARGPRQARWTLAVLTGLALLGAVTRGVVPVGEGFWTGIELMALGVVGIASVPLVPIGVVAGDIAELIVAVALFGLALAWALALRKQAVSPPTVPDPSLEGPRGQTGSPAPALIESSPVLCIHGHAYDLCDDCRGFWTPSGDRL